MEQIIPIKYEIIQKPMTITFEKGLKVIIHPSGVISKYDKVDIQNFKDELIKEKENIDKQIKELDRDLININLTL